MSRFWVIILVAFLSIGAIGLTGCSSGSTKTDTHSKLSYTVNPDGTKTMWYDAGAESKANNSSEAPTATLKGAEFTVNADGSVTAKTNGSGSTGGVTDLVENLMKWPIIFGAIVLVVGIVLFFTPMKKLAIGVSAGGLGLMVLAYLLAAYSLVFLIISLLVIIGAVIYVFLHMKQRDVSLKDLVQNIEVMKKNLSPSQRDEMFNGGSGTVTGHQSPETKKVVKQLRKKLGLK